MELAVDLGFLLAGGVVLYFGAEWLVRGAAGLANAFGVKPLVVGLTVVAYGTSAPELAVSSIAMLDGKSDLALGNVIGSNIANLGLILGLTALISPPGVDGRMIKREIPVLVLSTLLLSAFLYDGSIGWLEAAALLSAVIGFTVWTLTSEAGPNIATADAAAADAEAAGAPGSENKLLLGFITLVGLGALAAGGDVFVRGAVGIADALGISDRIIGLTVIAVGTSLPELATCIVAATRGHSSIAVGTVVGSNIFNVFLIVGVMSFIGTLTVPLATISLEPWFLGGLTLFGALTMRGDRRVTRFEGALLVGTYVAFVVLAVLRT